MHARVRLGASHDRSVLNSGSGSLGDTGTQRLVRQVRGSCGNDTSMHRTRRLASVSDDVYPLCQMVHGTIDVVVEVGSEKSGTSADRRAVDALPGPRLRATLGANFVPSTVAIKRRLRPLKLEHGSFFMLAKAASEVSLNR